MLKKSVKNGLISGIKSCWFLIKVIIPVYFVITVIKNTPAMDWLASGFAPLMGAFRLPGEAAMPIITGIVLDEFGVIAAITAVGLSGYAVTVTAVMAIIAHAFFVEGAIIKKLGLSVTFFSVYRLIAAFIAGMALSAAGTALQLW